MIRHSQKIYPKIAAALSASNTETTDGTVTTKFVTPSSLKEKVPNRIYVSATQPTGMSTNDVWIDIS